MAKNSTKAKKEETVEEEINWKKEAVSTILYLVFVCAAVFIILTYVGQRTVVNGPSMEATLYDGENLIMDKISYRLHDPKRFDIVIFPGPEENGENPFYIKRVIGLPGETVQIEDGKVYIDGEELTEDTYGITDYIERAELAEDGITLDEDEYFCLGDNRPVSYDSRYEKVGPVNRSEIVGKVWIRIWPLSKFGNVDK